MTSPDGPPDLVQRAIDDWRAQGPELDLAPVAVIARLARAMSLLEPSLESALRGSGLNRASFDTLSVLRRAGAPYQLSARQLAERCMRSSATLTARIANLTDEGLVTREPDPGDARSVLVTLTAHGRETVDNVVPTYLTIERGLLAGLDDQERDTLAHLLKVLLLSLEASPQTGNKMPGMAVPALQIHLESIHAALSKRRAVALPERLGLLVSNVDPAGVGAEAGLLAGDLIIGVSGTLFRSVPQLNHSLAQAAPERQVQIAIVRGNDELQLTVRRLHPT